MSTTRRGSAGDSFAAVAAVDAAAAAASVGQTRGN